MRSGRPSVSSSVQLSQMPTAAGEGPTSADDDLSAGEGSTAADADSSAARLVDQAGQGSNDESASAFDRHFSLLFYNAQHRKKNHFVLTAQGRVYNFLERPTGWKCFLYHFTV